MLVCHLRDWTGGQGSPGPNVWATARPPRTDNSERRRFALFALAASRASTRPTQAHLPGGPRGSRLVPAPSGGAYAGIAETGPHLLWGWWSRVAGLLAALGAAGVNPVFVGSPGLQGLLAPLNWAGLAGVGGRPWRRLLLVWGLGLGGHRAPESALRNSLLAHGGPVVVVGGDGSRHLASWLYENGVIAIDEGGWWGAGGVLPEGWLSDHPAALAVLVGGLWA